MLKILDKIPYPLLIVFAILMLALPIRPMPHVAEKIIMLTNGTLTRPIDVFDLFFHLFPLLLLIMKFIKDRK
jgi:hypothetical protein